MSAANQSASKVGRVVSSAPWPIIALGEVVESMKNGIYRPASAYSDDGLACLRMYNIDDGRIVWKDIKRMRLTESEIRDYELVPGDLLVNRVNSRELVGKTAVIPDGLERCVFESKNIRVRVRRDRIEPKFAAFALLASGRSHFDRNAQQVVGMASISQPQVASFPLPLPPLSDQRRIVAEIEKQFTRLDAGVAALRRVHANLKRYRAAVIDFALAVDWPTRPLVEIGEVVTGTTPSPKNRENYGGYLPFFTPGDLNAGYRLERAAQQLSPNGAALARPLPAQTVLVTCIGATIGKTALARVPSATNQQINAFIPHDTAVLPEWAFWMFTSLGGQKQIRENASATTMPILNKSRFGMLSMPVPPLATQRKLIAEIERKLTIADTLGLAITQTSKRAGLLKRSILTAAFQGRLSD